MPRATKDEEPRRSSGARAAAVGGGATALAALAASVAKAALSGDAPPWLEPVAQFGLPAVLVAVAAWLLLALHAAHERDRRRFARELDAARAAADDQEEELRAEAKGELAALRAAHAAEIAAVRAECAEEGRLSRQALKEAYDARFADADRAVEKFDKAMRDNTEVLGRTANFVGKLADRLALMPALGSPPAAERGSHERSAYPPRAVPRPGRRREDDDG